MQQVDDPSNATSRSTNPRFVAIGFRTSRYICIHLKNPTIAFGFATDMKIQPEKKRMQAVSFESVTECLDALPHEEVIVVERLRALIFECVPDVEEYLSFNVPYYRRNAGLYFIWPGSIGWGKSRYPGVRLGFQSGYLMADEIGYLDVGSRKRIYWRDFQSLAEIDLELLRSYLLEAVVVDDQKAKQKRPPRW